MRDEKLFQGLFNSLYIEVLRPDSYHIFVNNIYLVHTLFNSKLALLSLALPVQ